jgi:ParB family chromosome partitioning protein
MNDVSSTSRRALQRARGKRGNEEINEKTKSNNDTASIAVNGNKSYTELPNYKLIAWKDLQASPTNPRRRIDEESIESLAASIRTQNILEPLIVRPKDDKFEIVCGERRYRAAKLASLTEIPCLVRELTDDQVLDIQIHENLHRKDLHPMDEAYGYKVLQETIDCDIKELALRVGKSEGYVLNRLKLNALIKPAQKDIDDDHLPLVYALEIAKYTPDIQKIIYAEVYRKTGTYKGDKYVVEPVKGETVPLKSFVQWINENVHRILSKAPFDPKATDLRSDGLACVNCPERTGSIISLFEPNQIGRKDACLNPSCFKQKVEKHVEVRRLELAELRKVDVREVPIVRSWCYSDGKDYFGSESAIVVGDIRGASKKKCRNVVSGVDIEAHNYGQTVQVCLKTTGCKTHWPESKASSNGTPPKARSAEAEAAEKLEAHRARREEIWNANVAEAVRVRVFKQAAEKFEKKFRITDVGTDFLPQLIARFWRMTSSRDSNNLKAVVKQLIADWQGKSNDREGVYIQDGQSGIELLKTFDRGMQFRILFLLIHCHRGAIGYGKSYTSQREVRELAAEFDLDYALTDAEVRLELCAKKYKDAHQLYLDAIREKKNEAKLPHLFSEKWQPQD